MTEAPEIRFLTVLTFFMSEGNPSYYRSLVVCIDPCSSTVPPCKSKTDGVIAFGSTLQAATGKQGKNCNNFARPVATEGARTEAGADVELRRKIVEWVRFLFMKCICPFLVYSHHKHNVSQLQRRYPYFSCFTLFCTL